MGKKTGLIVLVLLAIGILYLLVWPVPVEPVAWQAPPNPGYTGAYAANQRLQGLELLSLSGGHGPEAVALDRQGRIYAATFEGWIVRLAPDGSSTERWVNTEGRPLGIVFDRQENLIVADAFRGLLRIAPDGRLTVLATAADGVPIRYADDVDVAADGRIYFSDASTKFNAEEHGTGPASLLDIVEHGGHGRLLVYDPATQKASTLLKGLNFANGVALNPDQTYVLVAETGSYRVLRYWLRGPKTGQVEPFIEALPGFPDNLTTGRDGRYWLALVVPRNPLLDRLADKPWLRKVAQRLPAFVRPGFVSYGHVIALDGEGGVMLDLQDPSGAYPLLTSATETADYLYLGSLIAPAVARLAKAKIGL